MNMKSIYIIYPHYKWWAEDRIIPGGKIVEPGFSYSSDNNIEWLSVDELKRVYKEVNKH